jgi:hypothetical protein
VPDDAHHEFSSTLVSHVYCLCCVSTDIQWQQSL